MPTRVSGCFLAQAWIINKVIEHVGGIFVGLDHTCVRFVPGQKALDSLLVLLMQLLQASISSVVEIDVISLEIATLLIELSAKVRI